MTTVDEILQESDDGSSLSAEVSFTLEDVLLEPDDKAIENIEQEALDEIDEEGMFDDDMFEAEEGEETAGKDESKVAKKSQLLRDSHSEHEYLPVEVVPIKRERRLKDSPLPDPATIRNMSFVVLKNVTELFQNPEKKGLGQPTVISASGNKFLAIGTSQGSIAVFEVGVRGNKLLGGEQQKRNGAITSMSISRENRFLVAGQEGGLVTVWDLSYFTELKRECWRRVRILKVLFCGEQEFLMNDQEGNVELVSIEKYLWTTLKPQKLLEKTDALYTDLRAHVLFAAPPLLALASLDYVLLLVCKPTVIPVARLVRPEDLLYNRLPCVAMGRCSVEGGKEGELGEVVCVAWGSSVVVYRVGEGRNGVKLAYRFELERAAQHIQFLSEGILVVLDGKQTFRSFRLWLCGHTLLNQEAIPEEVLFQRFLKDRQANPIRSYHNTLISCSLGREKQLFFICKNSIYRCRMHRWNEAVSELINNQHQYALALRLCLELYQSRLDVFLERVKVSEKSLKVFCEIGRLYLSEGLKNIENLNKQRVRNLDQMQSIKLVEAEVQQMYDSLIEYMLEIGQTEYLFEQIYRKIIKLRHYNDDFHFKFLSCLEPFITISALTRLPSCELFIQITQYFLKLGKKTLLQTLVMSLDVESLYYEEALDLCSSNKLYRALAYVCSTHNDYISPLNKLLAELTQAQRQGLDNAWNIYYDILKSYLTQLLLGKLINARPFKGDATMRKGLAAWLTCSQTFSFFASNLCSVLHTDYFIFLEDLLLQLSRQIDCQEYTHGILKQLMKERHKEQQIAELFVKVSPSIRLEQPEVDLVLKHSTQEQISSHLSEYLLFMKQYLCAQAIPPTFLEKNKQLSYYWQLLKQQPDPLLSSNVLSDNFQLNKDLVNFILINESGETVAEKIQDLLKIDSQSTMVYMLEKFSLQIVNSRLMTIRDEQYRYQVIRKLIKKLRKGKSGKLGPQVMKFYIIFLCKFNNQKRVYYQIVMNSQDYEDITVQLIEIISPLGYSSCLGVLQLNCNHLLEAYNHFTKVYKHYFFQENYKKLLAVKHCHGRFMRRIFQRMLTITQNINTEKQWMELLGCVIAPLEQVSKVKPRSGLKVCDEIQDIYEKKSQQPFLQQLGEILEECLVNVSSRLPIATISAFIGKHAYLFSKTLVLNSFRTTLATYSKNAHIYLLANQMVVDAQVAQFNKLQSYHIQGIVPSEYCQICRKNYQVPVLIKLYPCGHSYHSICEPVVVLEKQEEILQKQQPKEEENKQTEEKDVDQALKKGIEQKCHKCRELIAGSSAGTDSEIVPDFHKESEDSLLLKGVKGIVNIIPTVIKAIPNPISVFTTPIPITDSQLQEQQIDENEVYEYLAFQKSLLDKQEEFSNFLGEYRHHLEQY